MARTLSDEAWADICAAGGLTPDAEARAALTTLLFDEYPAFAYRRAEVKAAFLRSGRMLKYLHAFEADYRVQFPSRVWKTDRDYEIKRNIAIKIERDLWCLEGLRRRTVAVWLYARTIRRANEGKKNAQHEWLYHRLCTVWLDHFHAPGLSITRGGPLIRFMLAALRQIMPQEDLPSPETVRDGIKRDRDERANVAQLSFEFKLRKTTKVD